jgi:flagellin
LVSIRQLAVSASNLGTNSAVDVQADQTQINSAIASINNIAATTSFGNKKLLDGSATAGTTTTAGTATGAGIDIVSQGTYTINNAGTYDTIAVSAATAATEQYSFTQGGTPGSYLPTTASGEYSGSISINGTQYNLGTITSSTLAELNTAIASSGYQATVTANQELQFTSGTKGQLDDTPVIDMSQLNVGTDNAVTLANPSTNNVGSGTVKIAADTTLFDSTIGTNTITHAGSITYTLNGATISQAVAAAAGGISAGSFGANLTASMDNSPNTDLDLTSASGSIAIIGFGGGLVISNGTANVGLSAATISGANGNAKNLEYAANTTGPTLTAATARFTGVITASGTTGSNVFTIGPNTDLNDFNATLASVGVAASVDGSGNLMLNNTGVLGGTAVPTITMGTGFTAYAALGTNAGTFTNGKNEALTLTTAAGNSLVSSITQTVGSTNYYTFGNGLVVASTAAAGTITGFLTATAGATTTGQDLEFQTGANGGQTSSLGIASVAADQLGRGASSYVDANGTTQQVSTDSIADLNVLSFKGAQDAMAVIDKAINDVSTMSANLGAFQTNVLQSNVQSLNTASTNMSASLSTIEDTDMSTEIVEYTKNQILVQAGTSALGQANQAPQNILKLLQGT